MRRFVKIIIHSCIWGFLLSATAWGFLAIMFDCPKPKEYTLALAIAYAISSVTFLIFLRPRYRAYLLVTILFGSVASWWWTLVPRNDREWQADVAMLPRAEITGDKVTIRNVRNFNYRSQTDFDVRWETRKYDLSAISGLDLFVIYWGDPRIAHTILSWQFQSGENLAISIETRKENGEKYSAVRGFFRQYELYYVFSDERDVIALRTNHREESVYLYRLRTPPKRAKEILLNYIYAANQLVDKPKWYNALTDNCTNTIRFHADYGVHKVPYDWRWLVSGYLDELLYEWQVINSDITFSTLKLASHINARAKVARLNDFSAAIRIGLPLRPSMPLN
jgi:hypothetical protein